ncbi:MAG: Hpt domain-containing protein [Chloroflexi bacterium]|nr:Hpt domain-containing protein [Chloroflexota bacterium]
MAKNTAKNQLFDREAALKSLGSMKLLKKVAGLFLENGPELLANVNQAIVEQDAAKLERSAHKLVSSMAYLVGSSTRGTAVALEQMGRSNDLRDAPETFARLASDVERLTESIKELLQEEEPPRES